MNRGMILLLILLAVLVANLFYSIRGEGGVEEIPRLLERVGIELPNE